jgi:hypothetical protein
MRLDERHAHHTLSRDCGTLGGRGARSMTAESLTSVRELDCRWTNGIQVRLLWREFDGRVSVAVVDTRSRDSFRLDVPDGERPLDVFYHPFAYAAH